MFGIQESGSSQPIPDGELIHASCVADMQVAVVVLERSFDVGNGSGSES
jgi:hypothetical protein